MDPDGRGVTIPNHGGREIGPPLFYRIIEQIGISADEFRTLK
jgi:predicted RNA binding protein YcfA (HicA-like mRNA interferase family)